MTEALRPGKRGWLRAMLVVPFLALAVAGMLYTNHVQKEGEQRWCELIIILDEQYQAAEIEDPVAQRFADALHRLLEQLPCN